MRGILAALLAAGALALAGCGGAGQAENAADEIAEIPVNVRTLTIEPTELSERLGISGTLRPVHATDVSTEETGIVESIPREKGVAVSRGDVVVLLRRDVLEAEKRAAEARRAMAAYTSERTQQLWQEKQASREEALRAETALAEAEASADVARLRWERAAIRAPFDGIWADRRVVPGELVAAGAPVGRIVDPYTLKLTSFVSEREVSWLRKGAEALVRVDGVDRPVEGRVHWISFEADPSSGKFQVELRIDNAQLALRPGIVARAEILTRRHDGVVVVPRDAILLQKESPAVFVVDGDRARTRAVTLGADQGLMTIVRAGLAEGDRIVVRGQRDLRDGSLVRVREEAAALDGSSPSDPAEVRAAAAGVAVDAPTATEGRTP